MRGKLARTVITAAAALRGGRPLGRRGCGQPGRRADEPAIKVGPKQHVRGFFNTKNSKESRQAAQDAALFTV